jgi:hypothetical protein
MAFAAQSSNNAFFQVGDELPFRQIESCDGGEVAHLPAFANRGLVMYGRLCARDNGGQPRGQFHTLPASTTKYSSSMPKRNSCILSFPSPPKPQCERYANGFSSPQKPVTLQPPTLTAHPFRTRVMTRVPQASLQASFLVETFGNGSSLTALKHETPGQAGANLVRLPWGAPCAFLRFGEWRQRCEKQYRS